MSKREKSVQRKRQEIKIEQLLSLQELENINAGTINIGFDTSTPIIKSQITIIGGFKSISGMD